MVCRSQDPDERRLQLEGTILAYQGISTPSQRLLRFISRQATREELADRQLGVRWIKMTQASQLTSCFVMHDHSTLTVIQLNSVPSSASHYSPPERPEAERHQIRTS